MTPTARALQQLRKDGWLPAVTEKWNPGARVRQDLYGFADLVAVRADNAGVLAIQVTTNAHMADRFTKLTTAPVAPRVSIWLQAGNDLEVWGWAKQGARGKRKTWTLTRREVTLRDLETGCAL